MQMSEQALNAAMKQNMPNNLTNSNSPMLPSMNPLESLSLSNAGVINHQHANTIPPNGATHVNLNGNDSNGDSSKQSPGQQNQQQRLHQFKQEDILQALQYNRAMNSLQAGYNPMAQAAGTLNPALAPHLLRTRALLGSEPSSNAIANSSGPGAGPGMGLPSHPFLPGLQAGFYSNPAAIENLAMYNPQAAALAAAQGKNAGAPGQENNCNLGAAGLVLPQQVMGGAQGGMVGKFVQSGAPAGKTACLYLPGCDDETLSEYQILLRKQIEFFEAQREDVETVMPGRKKGIELQQVGIRCRHCSPIPLHSRTPGAAYFPAKMSGLYQAAQNLAKSHLCGCCDNIPDSIKRQLIALQKRSRAGHGGKHYWADGAKALGVEETERCLRFIEK
jgi:hypothetical protein